MQIKYPVTGIEWLYEIDRSKTGKCDVSIQSIGSTINLATTGIR